MTTRRPQAARSWLVLVGFLLAVLAVGAVGSWVTLPNIPTWYAQLRKPWFNPPPWVFGPAWTLLYAMMAVAAWRVATTDTMLLFWVQLGLNALWSPVFFAFHQTRWALAVIVALLAAIGATIALFRSVDRTAALLLVPYFAWVAFATVLNSAIVALNP
jgi:tryptophan-rich sensory protein